MKSLPKIATCVALLVILPQAAQGGGPEIAYSAGCEGNISCIWVMDADGSNKRMVYQGEKSSPYGLWPSWSPDGVSLAFDYFSALYRIDVDHLTVYPDGAGCQICCSGTCTSPSCEYDTECDDDEICTDDTCYPCSGCENVFDSSNDPDCQAPCTPAHEKERGPRCSDGIDNDCDGPTDDADPDCW